MSHVDYRRGVAVALTEFPSIAAVNAVIDACVRAGVTVEFNGPGAVERALEAAGRLLRSLGVEGTRDYSPDRHHGGDLPPNVVPSPRGRR